MNDVVEKEKEKEKTTVVAFNFMSSSSSARPLFVLSLDITCVSSLQLPKSLKKPTPPLHIVNSILTSNITFVWTSHRSSTVESVSACQPLIPAPSWVFESGLFLPRLSRFIESNLMGSGVITCVSSYVLATRSCDSDVCMLASPYQA